MQRTGAQRQMAFALQRMHRLVGTTGCRLAAADTSSGSIAELAGCPFGRPGEWARAWLPLSGEALAVSSLKLVSCKEGEGVRPACIRPQGAWRAL
jgi:hypothetical protein